MEYEPPNDEGLPRDLYQKMTELMQVDIKTQVFSDTLIYYAAMWPYSGNYPMTAIHALLSTCAATFIHPVSCRLVCRGSLNIGIAGQFFDGEIYGPALADVYDLESQVSFICINRAWLDTEEPALQERGELISERIAVKCGVSLEHQAGLSNGLF